MIIPPGCYFLADALQSSPLRDSKNFTFTLPETNIDFATLKMVWLELDYDPTSYWGPILRPIFRCENVSFRGKGSQT